MSRLPLLLNAVVGAVAIGSDPTSLCESITYHTSQCDGEYVPIPLQLMETCLNTICNKIDRWAYARGADDDHVVLGSAFYCGISKRQAPTTDIFFLCTSPPQQCRDIEVSPSCREGTQPVSVDTMRTCSDYVCLTQMTPQQVTMCHDPNYQLMGSDFNCTVVQGTLTGDMLCEPVPAPPPYDCRNVHVVNNTAVCSKPLSDEKIEMCLPEICDQMNEMGIVAGANVDKRIFGSGYVPPCSYQTSNIRQNGMVCEDDPVCNSIVSVRNSKTCDSGMVPVPESVMSDCSYRICNYVMSDWEIACGADAELMGSGYGCTIDKGSCSGGDILCYPRPTLKLIGGN